MYFLFLLFPILMNFSISCMNGPFPELKRNDLCLIGDTKNTKIIPQSITIYNGSWQKKVQRTVYHRTSVTGIAINSNDSLAPEAFCKKVAALAKKHTISVPIVPFVRDDVDRLYFSSEPLNHIIFFPREYIENTDHPYLEFLIGHELGHFDNETREYKIEKYFMQTVIRNSIIDGVGLVGVPLLIENPYVCYPLMIYFGCCTLLLMIIMCRINRSIEVCHNVEYACDAAAVEKFGNSPEEKIAIAQQGIAYFKEVIARTVEKRGFRYIKNVYVNGLDAHPTELQRIEQLEGIINKLSACDLVRYKI